MHEALTPDIIKTHCFMVSSESLLIGILLPVQL